MLTKRLVEHILRIASPNNYGEVVVKCCRKYPSLSFNDIDEVVKEVYNLKGWRQDRYISKPSRIIAKLKREEAWDKLYSKYYGEEHEQRETN